MFYFLAGLIIGFAAGMLVYRRNKKHSEAAIRELKDRIENLIKK